MRSLTEFWRLSAHSIPEIVEGLKELELRYGRTHRFRGKMAKAGPMMNAIVLHFLRQDEATRAVELKRAVAYLEEVLESDEPVPLRPPDKRERTGAARDVPARKPAKKTARRAQR